MSNKHDDIMTPGPKILTSFDRPFTNSKALLIEYDDIMRASGFGLLQLLLSSDEGSEIFDFDDILDYSFDELFEFYTNRKQRNILSNFNIFEDSGIEFDNDDEYYEITDKILDAEYSQLDVINMTKSKLIMYKSVEEISKLSILNKIYVYSDKYYKFIDDDLKKNFSDKIVYVYGKLSDIIKERKIPEDSTFILSNLDLIDEIDEAGILNFSCIVSSGSYFYNDYEYHMDRLNKLLTKFFTFNSAVIYDDEQPDEYQSNYG